MRVESLQSHEAINRKMVSVLELSVEEAAHNRAERSEPEAVEHSPTFF